MGFKSFFLLLVRTSPCIASHVFCGFQNQKIVLLGIVSYQTTYLYSEWQRSDDSLLKSWNDRRMKECHAVIYMNFTAIPRTPNPIICLMDLKIIQRRSRWIIGILNSITKPSKPSTESQPHSIHDATPITDPQNEKENSTSSYLQGVKLVRNQNKHCERVGNRSKFTPSNLSSFI